MAQTQFDLGAVPRATNSTDFAATRAEGLRRLAAFVPRAGRVYADGRNVDHGPQLRDNVSVLSPYLRHRLITEREVVDAVLAQHSPAAAEKFVAEVLWRTYWKGWLERRPEVWTRFVSGREMARDNMARTSGLAKAVAVAEAGNTGIAGFDDWARELAATGYLHNHARMWVASIWIFTLKLPWELGADFFLRHLIDADPASNTLSWRWVAGLQTVGKTYLATASNIARYTDDRFEPKGLATSAQPLTEPPVPKAHTLRHLPVAPLGPVLLLVTAEDLHPESVVPEGQIIAGVTVIHGADHAGGWPWGDKAAAFVVSAAGDAATRAAAQWGCQTTVEPLLDANQLITRARTVGARAIVTPYAPVGPIADALACISPQLAAANVPLVELRRSWDERFWPYATKGFFAFKERIPDVLAVEGLRG